MDIMKRNIDTYENQWVNQKNLPKGFTESVENGSPVREYTKWKTGNEKEKKIVVIFVCICNRPRVKARISIDETLEQQMLP